MYEYDTFEWLWKVVNANNYIPVSALLISNPATEEMVIFPGITIYD